jgi:long-chain acyl-CoA synthetase
MAPLNPFDQSGIERHSNGVAHYQKRASSLVHMLRSTVDASPNTEALVEIGAGQITYPELWDGASRVAGGLREQGIERGDRVAIRLRNGIDWCIAFFGIQLCGAAAVPVNTRLNEPEIEYIVNDSGCRFVLLPDAPLPNGKPFAIEDLGHQDLSAIFYTSGTTGFPKGAMTTHGNFLTNMETARRVGIAYAHPFRNLVSAPLFHVTGCNTQLLPTCEAGGTTVILSQFEVQAFLRAIEAERIEVMITVPAIYWLALHQENFRSFDLTGVRRVAYGGAAAAPDLIAGIIRAFPNASVSNSYGLTEVSSIATFLPAEYSLTRPDSVGLAAPVVDLRLDDLAPGSEVGELMIRGANVVPGYWNKPDETAATFVDGWLRTGDLARIDAHGFVQIVDRKKDMVNRGGENVYCVEVESALSSHPDVFEVAVMGVPDPMMGEKVGAVVVPKPGRTVEIPDVIRFGRECLADFKVPQYIVIREEFLPRNPGGKILKKALRESIEWGKPLR